MFSLLTGFFKRCISSRKNWAFDFVIESLKEEDAEILMTIIILYAESHKAFVGGGCAPVRNDENEQK